MIVKKKRVFVGLSGGVDSSVAALRLIKAGFEVIGVFIKTWQPDFIKCDWEKERLDAMRVAAHLGIPFLTCDAEQSYRDEVAMYMIDEYKKGRVPNPDVMCNKYVKFDTFLSFALERGADVIATGHYAQIKEEKNGKLHLYRGADKNKDQSYFLWTLTQKQLKHTLFPVGDTQKDTVRDEAEHAGLLTFKKHDSQGVCFLGEIDMKKFLSHYIPVKQGQVLKENGEVVGTHDGAVFYTAGQRHGFDITTRDTNSAPWFVVDKNIEKNTITVSHNNKKIFQSNNNISVSDLHVVSEEIPVECKAQFRYRQKAFNVLFEKTAHNHGILTVQDNDIEAPASGQSCVLYKNDECLGGGIID